MLSGLTQPPACRPISWSIRGLTAPTQSRMSCGGRWAGLVEGRGEKVTGGQTAVGPPLFCDGDDLLLTWQMVELVGALHGLAQRQVAWQHDVFSLQRDEQRALRGPRAYPRDGRECCHELLV